MERWSLNSNYSYVTITRRSIKGIYDVSPLTRDEWCSLRSNVVHGFNNSMKIPIISILLVTTWVRCPLASLDDRNDRFHSFCRFLCVLPPVGVCRNKKKPLSPLSPRVNPVYQSSDPPVTATLRRMPINPLARNSCRRIVPIATPTSPPVAPPLSQHPSANSSASRSANGSKTSPKIHENGTSHPPSGSAVKGKRESHLTEVIAWPSDSLPRRVKKLSWEDEYNVFFWKEKKSAGVNAT